MLADSVQVLCLTLNHCSLVSVWCLYGDLCHQADIQLRDVNECIYVWKYGRAVNHLEVAGKFRIGCQHAAWMPSRIDQNYGQASQQRSLMPQEPDRGGWCQVPQDVLVMDAFEYVADRHFQFTC